MDVDLAEDALPDDWQCGKFEDQPEEDLNTLKGGGKGGKGTFNGECGWCGLWGHMRKDCRKKIAYDLAKSKGGGDPSPRATARAAKVARAIGTKAAGSRREKARASMEVRVITARVRAMGLSLIAMVAITIGTTRVAVITVAAGASVATLVATTVLCGFSRVTTRMTTMTTQSRRPPRRRSICSWPSRRSR